METSVDLGIAALIPTGEDNVLSIFKAVEQSGQPEVNVEISTVSVEEDLDSLFKFKAIRGGLGRLTIVSNELRRFLVEDTDTNLLGYSCIESDTDNEHAKLQRAQLATKDIKIWIGYMDQFHAIQESDVNGSSADLTFEQYKAFVDELQKHYDAYAKASLDAFESGTVTFEHLSVAVSTLKGTFVFREAGSEVCGVVKKSEVKQSFFGNYLETTLSVNRYDGKALIQSEVKIKTGSFRETKTLTELGITKLDLISDKAKSLIARGEKYISLIQKPAYTQVEGNLVRRGYWSDYVQNATGRVIIDLAGMKRNDENYSNYYGGDDRRDSEDDTSAFREVTDEIKMTCIPFLYGFSFKAKLWGEFTIDQISDIKFREDAYDKLVLDQDTKELIFALVEDSGGAKEADLIDGKGGGCIFLLEGNPGCGKTLTPETVAERLKRPLYSVSVGELGTDVDELERSLKRILEVATSWNAVLLIDEADIFLEARTDLDIERNAMVAVFLRLLEYYAGILFLTTNRAANLDPAFFSRIALAIHYDDLSIESREIVWTNLLGTAKIGSTQEIYTDELAQSELNGRQIKNVIKVAGALARYEDRQIDQGDFERVIEVQNKFQVYLAGIRKKMEAKVNESNRNWLQKLVGKFFNI